MELRELRREDMPTIVKWRNQQQEILRTSYLLTDEMQYRFYDEVICNRNSNCRFFAVTNNVNELIGMAGLENIQWDNRLAEISIITNPDIFILPCIFKKIKYIAFNQMNLNSIFTEVYKCSRYINAWEDIAKANKADIALLPRRKYWKSEYFDSYIYTFINHGEEIQTNECSSVESTSQFN